VGSDVRWDAIVRNTRPSAGQERQRYRRVVTAINTNAERPGCTKRMDYDQLVKVACASEGLL